MTSTNSGVAEANGTTVAPPPTAVAFLQQLDHDLRTPLGTMAAALDLLRSEPPGSAMHGDALAVMQRQLARLHSLTESVREFSQGLAR